MHVFTHAQHTLHTVTHKRTDARDTRGHTVTYIARVAAAAAAATAQLGPALLGSARLWLGCSNGSARLGSARFRLGSARLGCGAVAAAAVQLRLRLCRRLQLWLGRNEMAVEWQKSIKY